MTSLAFILNRTQPGSAPSEIGVFLTEADAQTWVTDVETMIDADAVSSGQFTVEPFTVDYAHVVITLEIENHYELYDYDDVTTCATNIVIPAPPSQDDEAEYDKWFNDNIINWSGVGNEHGDSWYEFKVLASSDESVIKVDQTFDWGF